MDRIRPGVDAQQELRTAVLGDIGLLKDLAKKLPDREQVLLDLFVGFYSRFNKQHEESKIAVEQAKRILIGLTDEKDGVDGFLRRLSWLTRGKSQQCVKDIGEEYEKALKRDLHWLKEQPGLSNLCAKYDKTTVNGAFRSHFQEIYERFIRRHYTIREGEREDNLTFATLVQCLHEDDDIENSLRLARKLMKKHTCRHTLEPKRCVGLLPTRTQQFNDLKTAITTALGENNEEEKKKVEPIINGLKKVMQEKDGESGHAAGDQQQRMLRSGTARTVTGASQGSKTLSRPDADTGNRGETAFLVAASSNETSVDATSRAMTGKDLIEEGLSDAAEDSKEQTSSPSIQTSAFHQALKGTGGPDNASSLADAEHVMDPVFENRVERLGADREVHDKSMSDVPTEMGHEANVVAEKPTVAQSHIIPDILNRKETRLAKQRAALTHRATTRGQPTGTNSDNALRPLKRKADGKVAIQPGLNAAVRDDIQTNRVATLDKKINGKGSDVDAAVLGTPLLVQSCAKTMQEDENEELIRRQLTGDEEAPQSGTITWPQANLQSPQVVANTKPWEVALVPVPEPTHTRPVAIEDPGIVDMIAEQLGVGPGKSENSIPAKGDRPKAKAKNEQYVHEGHKGEDIEATLANLVKQDGEDVGTKLANLVTLGNRNAAKEKIFKASKAQVNEPEGEGDAMEVDDVVDGSVAGIGASGQANQEAVMRKQAKRKLNQLDESRVYSGIVDPDFEHDRAKKMKKDGEARGYEILSSLIRQHLFAGAGKEDASQMILGVANDLNQLKHAGYFMIVALLCSRGKISESDLPVSARELIAPVLVLQRSCAPCEHPDFSSCQTVDCLKQWFALCTRGVDSFEKYVECLGESENPEEYSEKFEKHFDLTLKRFNGEATVHYGLLSSLLYGESARVLVGGEPGLASNTKPNVLEEVIETLDGMVAARGGGPPGAGPGHTGCSAVVGPRGVVPESGTEAASSSTQPTNRSNQVSQTHEATRQTDHDMLHETGTVEYEDQQITVETNKRKWDDGQQACEVDRAALEEQLKKSKENETTLQAEKQKWAQELETWKVQKAELEKKLEIANEDKIAQEAETQTWEGEKQAWTVQQASFKKQLKTAKEKEATLEAEKQKWDEEKEDLEKKLATAEGRVTELEDEKADLERQKTALQEELTAADEESNKLGAETQRLEGEKAAWLVQEVNLEQRLKTAESNQSALEAQKKAWKDEKRPLLEQADGTVTKLTEQEEKVRSLQALPEKHLKAGEKLPEDRAGQLISRSSKETANPQLAVSTNNTRRMEIQHEQDEKTKRNLLSIVYQYIETRFQWVAKPGLEVAEQFNTITNAMQRQADESIQVDESVYETCYKLHHSKKLPSINEKICSIEERHRGSLRVVHQFLQTINEEVPDSTEMKSALDVSSLRCESMSNHIRENFSRDFYLEIGRDTAPPSTSYEDSQNIFTSLSKTKGLIADLKTQFNNKALEYDQLKRANGLEVDKTNSMLRFLLAILEHSLAKEQAESIVELPDYLKKEGWANAETIISMHESLCPCKIELWGLDINSFQPSHYQTTCHKAFYKSLPDYIPSTVDKQYILFRENLSAILRVSKLAQEVKRLEAERQIVETRCSEQEARSEAVREACGMFIQSVVKGLAASLDSYRNQNLSRTKIRITRLEEMRSWLSSTPRPRGGEKNHGKATGMVEILPGSSPGIDLNDLPQLLRQLDDTLREKVAEDKRRDGLFRVWAARYPKPERDVLTLDTITTELEIAMTRTAIDESRRSVSDREIRNNDVKTLDESKKQTIGQGTLPLEPEHHRLIDSQKMTIRDFGFLVLDGIETRLNFVDKLDPHYNQLQKEVEALRVQISGGGKTDNASIYANCYKLHRSSKLPSIEQRIAYVQKVHEETVSSSTSNRDHYLARPDDAQSSDKDAGGQILYQLETLRKSWKNEKRKWSVTVTFIHGVLEACLNQCLSDDDTNNGTRGQDHFGKQFTDTVKEWLIEGDLADIHVLKWLHSAMCKECDGGDSAIMEGVKLFPRDLANCNMNFQRLLPITVSQTNVQTGHCYTVFLQFRAVAESHGNWIQRLKTYKAESENSQLFYRRACLNLSHSIVEKLSTSLNNSNGESYIGKKGQYSNTQELQLLLARLVEEEGRDPMVPVVAHSGHGPSPAIERLPQLLLQVDDIAASNRKLRIKSQAWLRLAVRAGYIVLLQRWFVRSARKTHAALSDEIKGCAKRTQSLRRDRGRNSGSNARENAGSRRISNSEYVPTEPYRPSKVDIKAHLSTMSITWTKDDAEDARLKTVLAFYWRIRDEKQLRAILDVAKAGLVYCRSFLYYVTLISAIPVPSEDTGTHGENEQRFQQVRPLIESTLANSWRLAEERGYVEQIERELDLAHSYLTGAGNEKTEVPELLRLVQSCQQLGPNMQQLDSGARSSSGDLPISPERLNRLMERLIHLQIVAERTTSQNNKPIPAYLPPRAPTADIPSMVKLEVNPKCPEPDTHHQLTHLESTVRDLRAELCHLGAVLKKINQNCLTSYKEAHFHMKDPGSVMSQETLWITMTNVSVMASHKSDIAEARRSKTVYFIWNLLVTGQIYRKGASGVVHQLATRGELGCGEFVDLFKAIGIHIDHNSNNLEATTRYWLRYKPLLEGLFVREAQRHLTVAKQCPQKVKDWDAVAKIASETQGPMHGTKFATEVSKSYRIPDASTRNKITCEPNRLNIKDVAYEIVGLEHRDGEYMLKLICLESGPAPNGIQVRLSEIIQAGSPGQANGNAAYIHRLCQKALHSPKHYPGFRFGDAIQDTAGLALSIALQSMRVQGSTAGETREAPPTAQNANGARGSIQQICHDKVGTSNLRVRGHNVERSAELNERLIPTGECSAPRLYTPAIKPPVASQTATNNPLSLAQVLDGKIPFAPGPSKIPSEEYPTPTSDMKPAPKWVAAVCSTSPPGEAVELSEIDTNFDSEEDESEKATWAPWVASSNLETALTKQQDQLDPSQVFGQLGPLEMEAAFGVGKDQFPDETSDRMWRGTYALTSEEIRKDATARDKMKRDGCWSHEVSKIMM